ncbi:hypothetical protein GOEFS_132_00500 [Gordonia effusa NBRC 100432]|uniref:DUF1365 domain-containing protein n=1 Tax=Gordonia effusa NBRC 100432 TaxID=1077974 RepID=H0R6W8_9ACTN|nr:DUF1365 domain-containing protein [Gordonia effusa]GAB20819.1 hypothetical protein GOEFS_132_00500 [Gordonia effusa NBRC 100432]
MTHTPAMYRTEITHRRTAPVVNRFRYRSLSWFIDIDDLPPITRWLRPFASFRARDHLSPPEHGRDTLRNRVDAELERHGITPQPGTVTALLNARTLGYVFDPLTLYWCHRRDGQLYAVLAEVHNTYGGRHCYAVVPDDQDRAQVDKEFYVSPFNVVGGSYSMRVPEPDDRLRIDITWYPPSGPPFHAAVSGTRTAVTTRGVLTAQLRAPLAPIVVSARIRLQGITLWRKGLQIIPRPNSRVRRHS